MIEKKEEIATRRGFIPALAQLAACEGRRRQSHRTRPGTFFVLHIADLCNFLRHPQAFGIFWKSSRAVVTFLRSQKSDSLPTHRASEAGVRKRDST